VIHSFVPVKIPLTDACSMWDFCVLTAGCLACAPGGVAIAPGVDFFGVDFFAAISTQAKCFDILHMKEEEA
jgi:hypothetical protein